MTLMGGHFYFISLIIMEIARVNIFAWRNTAIYMKIIAVFLIRWPCNLLVCEFE